MISTRVMCVVALTAATGLGGCQSASRAMGMTKELPLQMMAGQMRTMRIYDGPSEVHRWVIARDRLGLKR